MNNILSTYCVHDIRFQVMADEKTRMIVSFQIIQSQIVRTDM